MSEALAAAIFPRTTLTLDELEAQYPPRSLPPEASVTRFAPSPTGFLHMGSLFTAFAARLQAARTGGMFYLRIEDTDKKREVQDGISGIVNGLKAFGVTIDEGVTGYGEQAGAYGPYIQSKRKDIYEAVAKHLIRIGRAYPCFCTPADLNAMRAAQEAAGDNPGYYGKWAKCRNMPPEEVLRRIEAGEAYTLRFRAEPNGGKITVQDLARGKLEMPENDLDEVLLKSDNGLPTYHFAHLVDDHFMRTTHVIRGDEWLSSLPRHISFFAALGWKIPKYAHLAPMQIIDTATGGKRKLSKRKDPEADVAYILQRGYPVAGVREYLLTLLNSNFEDWRRANPTAALEAFPFSLKKLSASGALFDLVKLEDVSKTVISRMTAQDVLREALTWAEQYNPDFYALLHKDEAYALRMFSVGRGGKKPRKDYAKWSELPAFYSYFFRSGFDRTYPFVFESDTGSAAIGGGEEPSLPTSGPAASGGGEAAYFHSTGSAAFGGASDSLAKEGVLPAPAGLASVGGDTDGSLSSSTLAAAYAAIYDPAADKDAWFASIKAFGEKHGYCPDVKQYKADPSKWKGSVADVTGIIRFALTGRENTPDLWEIMQVLGAQEVRRRLTQ
ncbi:MAG: glutamate--tRNA ligase [Oscillospiraceae bacterium]|jgi:glutamyl-tRNA synthetase|nr:glutamate--tRNA ligase [Oscillospiraceae bacterium]